MQWMQCLIVVSIDNMSCASEDTEEAVHH
jgi:hypothetical protein